MSFSLYQGATLRKTLLLAVASPKPYTLASTVADNVITLTGSPAAGVVVTATVTTDSARSFALNVSPTWAPEDIASALAVQIAYSGSSVQSNNFTASSNSNTVTVIFGDTNNNATVACSVTQSTTTLPDGSTGYVADLSGCSARMMVRQNYASPALLTLTSDSNGGIVIDDTIGALTFTISAQQSASLPLTYSSTSANPYSTGSSVLIDPASQFPFDIKVTYPSGDVQVILEDQLTLNGAVTR